VGNGVVITEQKETKARFNIALLGSETNEQLSMRVQAVQPGEGTPLHVHVEQAETFDVGMDLGTQVSTHYKGPYAYSGELDRVIINLTE